MTEEKDKIRTEDEYRAALLRFLEIYDAPQGTLECEEAKYITLLMEDYERRYFREASCGSLAN